MTTVWEDHPLVLRAEKAATEAGEPTPLRVAEELLNVMNELEDRFPGIPFADVLADPAEKSGWDMRRIRGVLRRNGACEADIALVCPMSDDPELLARRAAMTSDPYDDKAERL